MNARLRKLLDFLAETFWLLPALMVLSGIVLAVGLIRIDRADAVPVSLIDSPWLYNGGGTGARTLLGAVASSTIGVAGTVFSITIAALSLAAGQMGPRLLRNFTHDRGNQLTLGAFLGTFSYTLMVLRSVRTQSEGAFVPHLALSMSLLLAFVCVGMLVYFVGHMASRINVDTVVDLVSGDVRASIRRLTLPEPPATDRQEAPAPDRPEQAWESLPGDAVAVRDARCGYLQHLDAQGLASWASERGTVLRLLVRPGDYVFPGAAIALMRPAVEGAAEAVRDATALGGNRGSDEDLEFTVRQLVEVAVRALSPGINDPHTAIAVLDRLGGALCDVASRHLPTGITLRGGTPALMVPAIDYDGLVDAMFHMIRQNAAGSVAVLARLIEVLTAVAGCERRGDRLRTLRRHADLVLTDAGRDVANDRDLADVRLRHDRFVAAAS